MGKLDPGMGAFCGGDDLTIAVGPMRTAAGSSASRSHQCTPKNHTDVVPKGDPSESMYAGLGGVAIIGSSILFDRDVSEYYIND